jgi:hypothetical protein
MLPCQKCGYDNELGRIFCHQCGEKLDLDAIKPVSLGGKSLKVKHHNAKKWIRHGIELVVLLALLAVVFLMLETPAVPPISTGNNLNAVDKKLQALERLVNSKRLGTLEILPSELQTYFDSLKFDKSDIKWGFVPERVRVECHDGTVSVHAFTSLQLGGAFEKRIYITYTGTPKIANNAFKFEPTGAGVGSLSWPLPLAEIIGFHDRLFTEVFKRLTNDKEMLSKLQQIEVKPDKITVWYQPR